MAYVPGKTHDVFISYARVDDVPGPNDHDKGWVSWFVTYLEVELRRRLGGTTELRVFFDRRDLQSNQQLAELETAARQSAVFVAIASPAYAQRPWTQRELAAFVKEARDLHRLFAVECLPLDDGETYPEPLQNHVRQKLWKLNQTNSRTPVSLSPNSDGELFRQNVQDVANQIRGMLKTMQASPPDPTSSSFFLSHRLRNRTGRPGGFC